jgi:cytochrome d ubiquinol oxidase subunit I
VAGSLLAFVVVYFVVFGIGTWYLLRLMHHTPHEPESSPAHAPIRTAGITPAPSLGRGGADRRPDLSEEAR